MKTTIDIPEKLLRSVVRHSKAKTKREAVLAAMEEYDRRRRMRDLSARLGKSDTFMTLEELMALRKAEMKE
ncbi:MAG: type II toxin-antitoxin system VapB family antitoxin [Acidobacteria bacterium]|nr:type II toxin-antitoxin system VapB family antitoxin [Acidobacteriota bacterium]